MEPLNDNLIFGPRTEMSWTPLLYTTDLLPSSDRFSIMHPNYWRWLNTIDEDDIKGCSVYYSRKKFTSICKNMMIEICNNYMQLLKKQRGI
jgi:hypothetical protein